MRTNEEKTLERKIYIFVKVDSIELKTDDRFKYLGAVIIEGKRYGE